MDGNPLGTTYKSRLMFYDLCVARTRWYGAALAAALAYSIGGLVEHPTALAIIIVSIVVTGATLGMQLFLYENESLKIRRIATYIELDQPLDSQLSPAPWGATFLPHPDVEFNTHHSDGGVGRPSLAHFPAQVTCRGTGGGNLVVGSSRCHARKLSHPLAGSCFA